MSLRNCLIKDWVPIIIACFITSYGCTALKQAAPADQPMVKVPARVTLIGLDHVYDGEPKAATASTDPSGLDVKITYDGRTGIPVNAGSYTVTAVIRDARYEGSATGTLIIGKASQKITFEDMKVRTYGDKPFAIDATASSGLKPEIESSNPSVAAISGNRVKIMGAGTAVISVSQAGDRNHLAADSAQQVLTVSKASAKISLDKLEQTYDGKPRIVEARTDPRGLSVKITYDGNDKAPAAAGSYTAAATVQDANYEGSTTALLTIAQAPQKITFKALQARTFGDTDFLPGATASSGGPVSYTSSDTSVAAIAEGRVHIVGAGMTVITAAQTGDGNYLAADSVQQVFSVNKAHAKVTFANLNKTYDGKPQQVTAVTTPDGLMVIVTYDGNEAEPINAGSYKVACTVQDANYEGMETALLTIAKAPQTITFGALENRTYGDAEFSPGAMTSAGLALTYKSSDPRVAIVDAGGIRIVGAGAAIITTTQAGDSNYLPAEPLQRNLTVNKAPAVVNLGNLEQTYDGKPKRISASTTPAGLLVKITYDGKDKAPVDAGSYPVAVTVQDANYEGKATAVLTIAKAPQSITFNALATMTFGDRPFNLTATLSSGLYATYESSDPQVAEIVGNRVKIIGAGTAVITALQVGDRNFLKADPVQQTLTINKAHAKVALGNLNQTYDGKPKQATSVTEPDRLNVTFTYDGNDRTPVNAGSYQVVGTVQEANYEGSAMAAMTIKKAPQRITFNPLLSMTFGETPFSIAATVSSGLTATYDSSNSAVATISGDQVTINGVGTTTITSYQAGNENFLPASPVQQVLVVNKAVAKIILSNLNQTYDGVPKPVGVMTSPEGLNVSIVYEGSDKIPVNAGSYRISVVVREENYEGSVSGTMIIEKAPQRITFNALSARTYNDETPYLLFATVSSGLTASYTSSNPAVAIVIGNQVTTKGAGTTTITAYQTGDQNHLPADPVPQELTIKKATALVALSGLDSPYTYDGKPRRAMVTTSPAGLDVSITYNGSSTAPADAGRYRVTATVLDANFIGTATGALTIKSTFQEIQFPVLKVRTMGETPFDLSVFLTSGLTASFISSDPTVATVTGNKVTITGAGTTTITAYQTGDRNYEAAIPIKRLLIVRGQHPRIVVFPVENQSGRPVPLKEIRQAISDGLTRQGDVVLDDKAMQKIMARYRIRYIGGVDTVTAKAWKEEGGMDAVLVTSIDQYEDSEVPKIALTSRLVTTGDTPHILWMENVDLSGDDSPGLFGVGLIDQIGQLQEKAIRQLLDSMAAFYADKPAPSMSSVAETFKPKAALENPFMVPDKTYTVAVLPFYNRSKISRAGEVLALRFVSQLVKNKAFDVLEPGVVRQKLLNYRIIMREGPSKEDMKSFFINLETDLILVGRLLEYEEGRLDMEFDVQVYDRKSGSTVWSSWSHNRGNDAVLIFDWKRVNNAGALASKMARSIVQDIATR